MTDVAGSLPLVGTPRAAEQLGESCGKDRQLDYKDAVLRCCGAHWCAGALDYDIDESMAPVAGPTFRRATLQLCRDYHLHVSKEDSCPQVRNYQFLSKVHESAGDRLHTP